MMLRTASSAPSQPAPSRAHTAHGWETGKRSLQRGALAGLVEKLNERLGGDHGREEVVDPLKRRSLLFRLLAGAGIADHDRQVAVVARRAGVALDAPVEMDAGQDNDFNALA